MSPLVSVVVPTRDRPEPLAACLAALEVQSAPEFEIVVVDDGSVDAGAVAAVVATVPRAHLIRGEGRGPAAARNQGASAARSPVLAFTDDDCRPAPAWIATLLARFDAGAVAVAGATVNGRPEVAAAVASQTITNHLLESSFDPTTGTLGFAPTSNVAVRTEIHAAHPFDESYPSAAGEDREWCRRLADHGVALRFEPGAVVHHHQDLSLRGFWRQQYRYGRGGMRWHRSSGFRDVQGPRFHVELLRRSLTEGPGVAALVVLAQGANVCGMAREGFAGVLALRRDRRST